MKIEIKSLFLLLVGMLFGVYAQAEDTAGNTYTGGVNHPYYCPTPGRLPIIAVTPIPEKQTPSKSAFQTLIDCGFNSAIVNGGRESLRQQFNAIKELDFHFIVSNKEFKGDYYKSLVDMFGKEPQLGGWLLADEPPYDKLTELQTNYNLLYNADPRHIVYVNLVGAQIAYFTGKTKNFTQYLELIQKTIRPSVWSYDLYPFSEKNGRVICSYDIFYSDLEMFRNMSLKTGRPFWAFCQGIAIKNQNSVLPIATEERLRFEAFNALAYGAQGIVYWTYGMRPSSENTTYRSALVDLNGTRSAAWYAAQKVNEEIKRYNDIFFGCEAMDVKHTGTSKYGSTTKLNGRIGAFSSVQSGSSGVVVSYIRNKDKEYMVIVSRDVDRRQDISVKLVEGKSVEEVTSLVINSQPLSSGFSFTLPKSGYAIFRIQ